MRCRSSGTGSCCRCGVGAVERDSPIRKQKPPNRKLQTGQQSHREAGAPQKLDSPPTRAGTLDGGSSGGLLPKLPVRAGNSGRRCRRTAQRSDVAERRKRKSRVSHSRNRGAPLIIAAQFPICPLGPVGGMNLDRVVGRWELAAAARVSVGPSDKTRQGKARPGPGQAHGTSRGRAARRRRRRARVASRFSLSTCLCESPKTHYLS